MQARIDNKVFISHQKRQGKPLYGWQSTYWLLLQKSCCQEEKAINRTVKNKSCQEWNHQTEQFFMEKLNKGNGFDLLVD